MILQRTFISIYSFPLLLDFPAAAVVVAIQLISSNLLLDAFI